MSKGLGISVVEADAVTIVRRRIVVVVSSVGACSDCRSAVLISPLGCQADRGTGRSVGSADSARVDRQRIVIIIRRL